MTNPTPTTGPPSYPQVTVTLIGRDGNAFAIIGAVARALTATVGAHAAATFTTAAYQCSSYDQLLVLVMRTVTVV